MRVKCKLHPDLIMTDGIVLEGENPSLLYDSSNPTHAGSDEASLYEEMQVMKPDDFIGLALHCIQQGQAAKVSANGYRIDAILMDQTCGSVSLDDIFKVNHSQYPYQRLCDILSNNFGA